VVPYPLSCPGKCTRRYYDFDKIERRYNVTWTATCIEHQKYPLIRENPDTHEVKKTPLNPYYEKAAYEEVKKTLKDLERFGEVIKECKTAGCKCPMGFFPDEDDLGWSIWFVAKYTTIPIEDDLGHSATFEYTINARHCEKTDDCEPFTEEEKELLKSILTLPHP
jgi:hypothetical protein